ncbi:hypothetical protein OAU81_00340 [bacterium]|nr:hypothetical protein [bacterium]
MKQYTITISDADTCIRRKVEYEAEDVYEAHKKVMMKHIVDYESESIVSIKNDQGETVYLEHKGFYETN